jgi:YfiH family protein
MNDVELFSVPHDVFAGFTSISRRYNGVGQPTFAPHPKVPERFLVDYNAAIARNLSNNSALMLCNQHHGLNIAHINLDSHGQPYGRGLQDADAMICNTPNVVVGVRVADCAGVVICAQMHGSTVAVAAVHSGWRGTKVGIIQRVVRTLVAEYSVNAEEMCAWIAPTAGGCCYVVQHDILEGLPEAGLLHRNNNIYFDNQHALRAQMMGCGLLTTNITNVARCTICDERYHSHRREKELSGRGLVFVGLR